MHTKVSSFGLLGISAFPVEIETDVSSGLPSITIVGLPDNAIKESRDRIRSCIKNSGFRWPAERITINLAPADIKKEGSRFDLPIALGILAASEQIPKQALEGYFFAGELALNGDLRGVKGSLSMALALKNKRKKGLILPLVNAAEAALVEETKIFGIKTLRELVSRLTDEEFLSAHPPTSALPGPKAIYESDFSEIKGQWGARRAMEVAAAGNHNILLVGPPGSGKSMLAKRLPTILPDLCRDEALDVIRIHSCAGLTQSPEKEFSLLRPFRSPHHTISDVAMAGGGSIPQAGEISLAHHGVLFLDELPEFHRDVLEVLRQPLEDGWVRIARVARSLSFPARFMLVAAMNPCPCGYLGDPRHSCRCTPQRIHQYKTKISGPLMDRIDIHVEVAALPYADLAENKESESSSSIKKRIDQARAIQQKRFSGEKISCNAHMGQHQLRRHCRVEEDGKNLLKKAVDTFGLSARAYDKILKISRTISDLAGSEQIKTEHLCEAIQYRSLDRDFFV